MNISIIFVSLLVTIIGVILMLSWGKKKSKLNSNKECIILDEKKVEGIVFGGCFDIWHISHFILWFIVGLIAPSYHVQVLVISILWELIEHYCFKKLEKCDSIFCGRIEDIFTNILAYSLGSYFTINGFLKY